jgi:hypothetical protein
MTLGQSEPHEQGSSPSPELPAVRYAVQLTDAYVVELSARRRLTADSEELESGTIEVAQPESHREDDGRHFSVVWRAGVTAPLMGVAAEIACAIEGQFSSEEPLSEEDFNQFRSREAFVLLWPYVRTAVGEAGRMLGLAMPPLPTVDVRSILGASASGAEEDLSTDPATG